ncbi:hypothetical protein VNI00_011019 [Paramarasmius palmivorus]|uniref:CBM21 domain-containing protein n=1 Tax=Paramarasmius palmivorus TaxID=297713 RepID=A0AAW0CEQ4_9AGAR
MSTMSTPVFDHIDVLTSRHSNSNTAGAPLPIIPRRSGSSSRLNTLVAKPSTSPPKSTPSPVQIRVQQATPPDDDKEATSSSSSSAGTSRRRFTLDSDPSRLSPTSKTRAFLKSSTPSEPATPTPAHRNPRSKKEGRTAFPTVSGSSSSSDEAEAPNAREEMANDATPRPSSSSTLPAIRRTTDITLPRTLSESHMYHPGLISLSRTKSPPQPSETPSPPSIIRKKSGQPVKSSLKSSCRSAFTGTINVNLGSGISSKSEPTTPTVPKAVKFDARLEHVKLFLAEQKPLAVSRDGSPTDETDSDFPDFIYGSDDKKNLTMKVVNMPSIINLNADVVLEEMKLIPETTSVVGQIRVRNLAYQKWVAVRFTFDDWQTTSEVTARYTESSSGNVDIFTFTIKLNDLLVRIEEKTMIVAVRYAVNGTDIWDNNSGKNYVVKFAREAPKVAVSTRARRRRSPSEESYSSGSDINDLKTRLEQVVQRRDAEDDTTSAVRARRGATPKQNPPPDFKKTESFAARYDFGSSFKESWAPPSASNVPHYATYRHARMNSYPALSTHHKTPEKPTPKVKVSLGSPRDLDGDAFRPSQYVPSDLEDTPYAVPVKERVVRNHHRGYFDVEILGGKGSGIKRTPPSGGITASSSDDSVLSTPLCSPDYFSLSPSDSTPRSLIPRASDLTPRNLTTDTLLMPTLSAALLESSSSSSSPASSSSLSSPCTDDFVSTLTAALNADMTSASPKTNYHQFLNKFCFYTGGTDSSCSSSSEANSPPEALSRSSSSSSVDEILGATSPRLQGFAYGPHISPPVMGSGSVTPTSVTGSNGVENSRCPTPLAA